MRRWLVLLNEKAGTIEQMGDPDPADRVRRAFAAHGVEPDVVSLPGSGIVQAVRQGLKEGYDAVIAGGGDGTLNAVATELIGKPAAFGVLPLGTFNLFAKEMGLPLDLDAAAGALVAGEARPLPVGEVNGRLFLNFSGIGLHPQIVDERDRSRTPGSSKMVATATAAVKTLSRMPLLWVRLGMPGRAVGRVTASVVVSNSAYQITAMGIQTDAFDRRSLHVFVASPRRPTGMAWLLTKAMIGRLKPSDSLERYSVPELDIRMHRRRVTVSIDGELVSMRTPLQYRVRQDALRVIVPQSVPEAPVNRQTAAA